MKSSKPARKHARPAAAARSAAPRVLDAPVGALSVLVPLALLLAARVALMFAHGTYLWGLDVTRYLAPAAGWAALALLGLTLLPPVAGVLASAASPAGRFAAAQPRTAGLLLALAAALLALLLPDRASFTGDFQMRTGAIASGQFAQFLPESLPFDVLLHYDLPRWLREHASLDPALYARLLGALEAGLLAFTGVAFARLAAPASEEGPDITPWLALAVVFGAPLVVFTGFPKSTADLCLLTLAFAVLGLQLLRGARVHVAFGVVLALGLVDHRTMLMLLPAACVVGWQRVRARDPFGALAMGFGLPLVVLLALVPELYRIVTGYDMAMHFRHAPSAHAGWRGSALHVLDVLNAVVLVAPALVLAPMVGGAWPRTRRRGELLFLVVMAAGFLPAIALVHPRQGLPRDWEIFAPAGVAITALIAWAVSSLVSARQARPWLAVSLAGAALVPALTLVLHAHSADQGIARANALLVGPPARDPLERVYLWDYLAGRYEARQQWHDAAAALEQVARAKPGRGPLLSWGLVSARAGELQNAREAFANLVTTSPNDAAARVGLGGVAERMGDTFTAMQMREELAPLLADPQRRAALRQMLDENPGLWPSLADSLRR